MPMTTPRMRRRLNHQVTIGPVDTSRPASSSIVDREPLSSAPGSKRNSLIQQTQQFVRNLQRRSLSLEPSSQSEWIIATINNRTRLQCQFKDKEVYYNTKQNKIVDINDIPYENSLMNLRKPSFDILERYNSAIEAQPKPSLSYESGRTIFGGTYYYNYASRNWHNLLNDKVIDGIRHPRAWEKQ